MTRLYLAGAYAARDRLAQTAHSLEALGHTVTSRWLKATHAIHPGTEGAALDHDQDYTATHVAEDFADIDAADVLVLYTAVAMMDIDRSLADPYAAARLRAGGRHIETGYALARGKRVIVVGEPENIFHRGACTVAPTFYDLVQLLGGDTTDPFTD